jgi:cell wall-associated NlpC family hydrolase
MNANTKIPLAMSTDTSTIDIPSFDEMSKQDDELVEKAGDESVSTVSTKLQFPPYPPKVIHVSSSDEVSEATSVLIARIKAPLKFQDSTSKKTLSVNDDESTYSSKKANEVKQATSMAKSTKTPSTLKKAPSQVTTTKKAPSQVTTTKKAPPNDEAPKKAITTTTRFSWRYKIKGETNTANGTKVYCNPFLNDHNQQDLLLSDLILQHRPYATKPKTKAFTDFTSEYLKVLEDISY